MPVTELPGLISKHIPRARMHSSEESLCTTAMVWLCLSPKDSCVGWLVHRTATLIDGVPLKGKARCKLTYPRAVLMLICGEILLL